MPKEVKRVNFQDKENIYTPYKTPVTECTGCKSVGEKITKLQETMENFQHEILSTMTAQNDVVMSALAEQKVLVQKLLQADSAQTSLKCLFPLNSTEDLVAINEKVVPETRSMMISTIRSLLQHSISKNLKSVFTDGIIMEYNVDGTHGKKSLKVFKNLYSVLLDSIISLNSNDGPETQLRKALQLNKKRFFQNKSKSAQQST